MDESVIGRKLNYPNGGDVAFEVAGVVADFNYWSLQTPIEPLGLFHISNEHVHGGDRKFVALRVEADGLAAWQRTLDGLRDVWKKTRRRCAL